MSTLDDLLAVAARELGLDPADLDLSLILDLARDVAHGVARPAAPLTAYLLGVATRCRSNGSSPSFSSVGTNLGEPSRGSWRF